LTMDTAAISDDEEKTALSLINFDLSDEEN
jgi:hypothetical protein